MFSHKFTELETELNYTTAPQSQGQGILMCETLLFFSFRIFNLLYWQCLQSVFIFLNFRIWVIKVIHCNKMLNLAEDRNSENKILMLGQDHFIGSKKNFQCCMRYSFHISCFQKKYHATS